MHSFAVFLPLKRRFTSRNTCKAAVLSTVLAFGATGSAFADLITNFGSAVLNNAGTVVVSGNGSTGGCINWTNSTTCPTSGSGTYEVESTSTSPFVANTSGTIKNLNFNTSFPVTQFITYASANGPVFFDLMDIRANTTGSNIGDCTSDSQDVSCTPAGSIFTLTDGPVDPNTGKVDTVTVSITTDLEGYVNNSGTNYNAANMYLGSFSTQAISGDITDILNTIASGGSIPASWSATIGPEIVNSTPEPATSSLLALGFGLIAVGFRKGARRQ